VGAGELGGLPVAEVVEVEELTDVLEREAEALALQYQRQPGPAAAGVEPLLAGAQQLVGRFGEDLPASMRGFPTVAEDKVWELQQSVGEHAAPARRR